MRVVAALLLAVAGAGGVARADSLYPGTAYRSLAGDAKAFQVGDAITVQVIENSSAATSAETSTQRNNGIDASLGLAANDTRKAYGGSVNVRGTFDGGGSTQRANRVLAALTVTVQEVLPNGELRLGGEQSLTVNGEAQHVKLEGRVRPQDVTAGNIVLSTRLADARISYTGAGDVAERNKRGWWRQLLDALGL
ncbi:MAG: flagellar basal body L-ring protein FlgH [Anaeromyxobacter sp.]